MIYRHRYFALDTENRRVYDENNKPLRLTGNAFRLLVFLCSRKGATITDIGEELDSAKDYDENNVRQYKYKVNTVIGQDIIEYRNGIYSIVGEIKEGEGDRNTSLLRPNDISLEKKNMEKENNVKFYIIPGIIAIVFLILSLFSWPYSYYRISRVVITVIAIYYAYYLYNSLQRKDFWFWALIVVMVLFNPIFPIYLYDRSIWSVIDVAAAIFLGVFIIKFKKK